STAQNEKGLFTGVNWRFAKKWTMNTYLDIFSFPWLRYQVHAPSSGSEFMTQITFKPTRQFELYGRFRGQNRPRNSKNTDGTIKELEYIQQHNFRIHYAYKVSES